LHADTVLYTAPRRAPVFQISDLRKRRRGAGSSFELYVPNLTVPAGAVLLLKGSSGCGKSTLLDLLALALQPDQAGQFQFTPCAEVQADLGDLWRRRALDQLGWLRGEHIGYVLQTGGLLPFLTVRENIALPCRLLGRVPDAVAGLAKRLGITGQLDKWPVQLSVGERQRAAIARALAHRPSLILADEPTASVDPLNADTILNLLLELVSQFGVTTIIATHEGALTAGLPVLQHRLERHDSVTCSLFWN
jgi:putative ABC transport system ATP-binding protein